MTARGDQTRNHLLDVAEQLFGERGVNAVSLREIRIEAGARNTAAIQFHFGDREGLIRALFVENLIDMVCAALFAPAWSSAPTR